VRSYLGLVGSYLQAYAQIGPKVSEAAGDCNEFNGKSPAALQCLNWCAWAPRAWAACAVSQRTC
jgi:hypothetical protein